VLVSFFFFFSRRRRRRPHARPTVSARANSRKEEEEEELDDSDDDTKKRFCFCSFGVALLFQFQSTAFKRRRIEEQHVPPVERERTFPDVVFGIRVFLAAEEGVPIREQ
tara:strand:+ start:659 stop:985 length:327 start_codon:yes stop_codon:yes gene_type:complete